MSKISIYRISSTLGEIIMKVEMMREAQKKYFKTREKDDLVHSKNLEKTVDSLLENLQSDLAK